MKYVRSVTQADIDYVAAHMRPEDVEEVRAASGVTPLVALTLGVKSATVSFTLHNEGDIVAIGGVTEDPADPLTGHVWLLATPHLEKWGMRFLRHGLTVTRALNNRWPILTNWVDCRNAIHIRWLRWLGCRFISRAEIGEPGKEFIQFVRVADV